MPAKPKRLVILDTHAILHRAYHALPDFSSSRGEPTGALYGIISMLVRIINDLKPDYIVATFDLPGGTFRHAAYEKYKATRPEAEPDLVAQIKRSRDVMDALSIPRYEAPGFEADDCIGTIVKKLEKQKDLEIIIASGDMDTLQLVDGKRVRVFTLKKGLNDTVLYDEAGVKARFGFSPASLVDYKGLRGDPSDNIPGVKGVGEKTATTLIVEFGTIENLYKTLKKNPEKLEALGVKQGMIQKLKEQEEDAEFSRTLAEINTKAPIEFHLPKKTWRGSVDEEKLLGLLAELDFRSLIPRVKQMLSGKGKASEKPADAGHGDSVATESLDVASPSLGKLPLSAVSLPPGVSAEEFEALKIAVSVLDSAVAQPEPEDIWRIGKSHNFAEAKKHLLAQIQKEGLEFVYNEIELPLAPVLRAMEARGVQIDKKFLAKLSKEYTKELEVIAARIYAHAGREFNIASPKQLGEILFDTLGLAAKKKTAGGQRSTRESELIKLREAHPIIEDILSYRELSKLLSTYIDSIPTLLDTHNRLHTSYIQIGAATGRIASQNPNLQNIPIKSELGRAIRNAFVASEGMSLVSFDYSQIELRIAAFLSQDEALAEIFKSGRDVHREVAARVFGVKDSEVTYEQRRRAKVINFGILYGMGVTSLQQALGTSRKEAQAFYDEYFAAFPRLAAYVDEVTADAARQGYTQTFFGRRRYLDGIRSPIPYVRAAAERMAVNAPIQGTQADLVKLAMIRIHGLFEEEAKGRAYQLLQVHDELVFEIEKPLVKTLAPKIKAIMEECVSEKDRRGIPFIAEGKAGPDWGHMQEL